VGFSSSALSSPKLTSLVRRQLGHVPLSCEEAKKDKKLPGLHQVEEGESSSLVDVFEAFSGLTLSLLSRSHDRRPHPSLSQLQNAVH
jgi:hypothetical protein